ncbi:hypothetical protein [Pseudarthrobacter sp. PS3-L1]|uniref:phage tail tube protein n=1 Tax=Pseudarthrobacter sp. PS3-L1 TaxID=3046207 RepID=UPI0024B99DDB|nr:hypothetical protein [Pseudarthrobacter sp. PS3-L1]MDJ0321829.1 hypothetical protein [Pseudarthrobacter sp. PS3-L1]
MKVSADGKKKWALLLAKPAAASGIPSLTELNAGTDFSCAVLESDINWSRAASDRINEKVSCQVGNSEALGAANYDLALTFVREFLTAEGGPDITAGDKAYQALKKSGTEAWIYLRESAKYSTAAWAATDVIELGGRVVTDGPMRVNNDGNIKRRIAFLAQEMVTEVTVGAGV